MLTYYVLFIFTEELLVLSDHHLPSLEYPETSEEDCYQPKVPRDTLPVGRPPNPTEEEILAAQANPYSPELPDAFEELYDGQAAYIMDFVEDCDSDYDPALNPNQPTEAKPGSEDKVQILTARYAAGLPLWHDSDCYDHCPDAQDLEEELNDDCLEEIDDTEAYQKRSCRKSGGRHNP